jgi:hypothetical protein
LSVPVSMPISDYTYFSSLQLNLALKTTQLVTG